MKRGMMNYIQSVKDFLGKNRCNKKGQFFLLGAFIIAAILMGIGKVSNDILSPALAFSSREVKDELEREAQAAASYALNNHKNVSEIMENFSRNYVAYSRSGIFNSQYIFLYADAEEIIFLAFGDRDKINVNTGSGSIVLPEIDGGFLRLAVPRAGVNQANITFYGSVYSFGIRERDFHHVVRVEDEKGIYVSS